jgi:HlyD family secretion protein
MAFLEQTSVDPHARTASRVIHVHRLLETGQQSRAGLCGRGFRLCRVTAGGELKSLLVRRGARVKDGDLLFALETLPERAIRDEAKLRLAQGRAKLADAKKGMRPTEVESLEAQLRQARAALTFSSLEFQRQQDLARSAAVAQQDFDRAQSARDQNQQRVYQIKADLQTAKLGSRSDQIKAAEDNVRALDASLRHAQWNLSQKTQTALQAGLVFDTLYREGEWVAAGKPVVVLLTPQNIKVRAFVSQTKIGTVQPGDSVQVFVDGVSKPFVGTVSYISPRVEYTPPVIYSRESGTKLVVMVEAVFDPKIAKGLHPGQPVDVGFGS